MLIEGPSIAPGPHPGKIFCPLSKCTEKKYPFSPFPTNVQNEIITLYLLVAMFRCTHVVCYYSKHTYSGVLS